MAKKAAYWEKRAERRALDTEKRANEAAKAIDRAVAKAAVVIRERTDNLLRNYQKRYGLDEQTARAYLASPVSYDEYTTLLYEIATLPDGPAKREAQARAASGAYSYRMSREQSLEASIRVETGRIAQAVEREATSALGDVARESERQTAYEQQMQTGGGPFDQMSGETLDTLLHTRWSGANYSRRIWTDRDRLARALKDSIAGGLASHRRYGAIADELANSFGVARWKAMRLVRTEAAFINNLTSLRGLKKGGASSYKILETLDAKTCETCGMMDGRVYLIDQAEFGVNAPPFHPNCRGCIVAADAGKAGRRGQGKDGKSVVLPGDMTYEEWQAWQEAGCPEGVKGWLQEHRGLQMAADGATIAQTTNEAGSAGVRIVGKIDRELYRCVTPDITTDEVVITEERVQHIKSNHPEVYALLETKVPEVLENPDAILANKLFTAMILKECDSGECFRMVLRLATPSDPLEHSNSIITFMKTSQKKIGQNIRNGAVLYKRD